MLSPFLQRRGLWGPGGAKDELGPAGTRALSGWTRQATATPSGRLHKSGFRGMVTVSHDLEAYGTA